MDSGSSFITNFRPQKDMKTFLVLIFVLIIFGFAGYTAVRTNPGSGGGGGNVTPPESTFTPIAPYSVVYGYWTTSNSVIKAFDMSSGKTYTLGQFPLTVKQFTVISPQTLFYINATNQYDYGQEIVSYSVSGKKEETVIKADSGFGINDYVVSPGKGYLVAWELSMSSDGIVQGGSSRVYGVNVETKEKFLLYDEVASETFPIHYPIGVTDEGIVYYDKWIPNSENDSGAGWAYGMSKSSITGGDKEDISAVSNGTYGTQPVMSPTGRYIAFAGYNGAKGNGTDLVGGRRRALVSANTVDVFDTQSQTRTSISQFPSTSVYSSVKWDIGEIDTLLVSALSQNAQDTGYYVYSMLNNTSLKVNVNETVGTLTLLTSLPPGQNLVAAQDTSISAVGNLGPEYWPTITNYYVQQTPGQLVGVPIGDALTQYISIVPKDFFAGVKVPVTSDRRLLPANGKVAPLQLLSFELKPTLEVKRREQQNNPPSTLPTQAPAPRGDRPPPPPRTPINPDAPLCWDLATVQCNELLGTNYPAPKENNPNDGAERSYEWKVCFQQKVNDNAASGACSNSPLYLYGPEGLNVAITSGTPIYNESIPYKDGFFVTLGKDGEFKNNGKKHRSIAFDYVAAQKILRRPNNGIVVNRSDLKENLNRYGLSLGLNEVEISDLIRDIAQKTTGSYLFISHFDHKTSHAILPLTFDPQPDTYRNIVFFVKQYDVNPQISVGTVEFDPIKRSGFTAIEVSIIVE